MSKVLSTLNKYLVPTILALVGVLIVANTFLRNVVLVMLVGFGIYYGVRWLWTKYERAQEREEKSGVSGIGTMPAGEEIKQQVHQRQTIGKVWQAILFSATGIGMVILAVLLFTIIDDVISVVAIQTEVPVEEVTDGRSLEELSRSELEAAIEENLPPSQLRILDNEQQLSERPNEDLRRVIEERVLQPEVVGSWPLFQGLFNWQGLQAEVTEDHPRAELQWTSWLDAEFLTTTMSSTPAQTGVRTALLGSLWLIFITIIVAFPLGVGAAIYLEEYASDTKNPTLRRINEIIQTNINNLAGVPSIIYGMLGLAIFVRALEFITSGVFLGSVEDQTTANGRTIISGGLTMALLILPIIIINAQEAIRSVPNSLRQASYGLGATKWQTIWSHVLPVALPGILTGTILSMSRAIGETAPLIVVGASTFITTDPESPFAKFTVLPIQIYNWTAQPSEQFRNAAAAAIIVLLIVLLSMNAIATLLRNRFRRSI
jgi:phosphate transport system permease protein